MAEIQTRRTLDLKPDLYRRFALYCEIRGVAMSSMLESIIRPTIGLRAGRPAKRKVEQFPSRYGAYSVPPGGVPVNTTWRRSGRVEVAR